MTEKDFNDLLNEVNSDILDEGIIEEYFEKLNLEKEVNKLEESGG